MVYFEINEYFMWIAQIGWKSTTTRVFFSYIAKY